MPSPPVRVLTWNVFHCRDGGADPDRGHVHLARKLTGPVAAVLRRAAADVVLLQEVPPAALPALARGAGLTAGWSVLTAPWLGPVALRGWLGARDPDLWRSHEGQANALLLGPRVRPVPGSARRVRLSPMPAIVRAARRRGLAADEAFLWAREARAAVVARVVLPGGTEATVASLHMQNSRHPWQSVQEAEALAAALAGVAGPLIVGGDLNVPPGHPALAPLTAVGLGDPSADPRMGIDRVLVRGLEVVAPARRWHPEERMVPLRRAPTPGAEGGAGREGRDVRVLVSDHDPVEAVVRVPSG
ncbi:MAG TPA: endonuclease/exonuclease/phosphatase family protein [Miltoncostaeaceae bacterium]|nr:endonuclease/exonuclease/phosphatase family protein [Miltoncostaeaceae bacterium]